MTVSWLLAGLAAGTLNGLILRWSVNRLRPGASLGDAALALGGFPLRLGIAAALLAAALRSGVAPGLLAFAGLWLARWIVIYVTLSPPSPGSLIKSLRD